MGAGGNPKISKNCIKTLKLDVIWLKDKEAKEGYPAVKSNLSSYQTLSDT